VKGLLDRLRRWLHASGIALGRHEADRLRRWREDALLRRVVRNSGYLTSSNTVAAALSFVQGIFIARLLGVNGLGELTAIISFVTAVNVLLSFRMSEVVVRYLAPIQVPRISQNSEGEMEGGAIVKGAALIEAATSLVAFLVLVLLSGWAAQTFVKDPAAQPLVVFYGLIILSNLIFETSRGVLQAYGQFGRFAVINLSATILTFVIVLATALFIKEATVGLVLAAYVAGKTLAGVAVVVLAVGLLNQRIPGWTHAPLRAYGAWRGLFGFAVNTNLNATVNLFVRDNLPLYVAALTTPTQTGYFKLAQSLTNLLMLPIDPFIWPTYTEITHAISHGHLASARRLLKRVSAISAAWVLAAGGAMVLFGWWLIPLIYGAEYSPAYLGMVILLVGYGFASVFGWNRPLLLALGRPSFPVITSAIVGAVELVLLFSLVPKSGYLVAAALLSAYLIVSIAINVWRGATELRQRERLSKDTAGHEVSLS
jgi:O-antigen/teichoic acid export membrane protein